jgi:hypothetical protein
VSPIDHGFGLADEPEKNDGNWPPVKGLDDHPDRERIITRDALPPAAKVMHYGLYQRKSQLTLCMGPFNPQPNRPITVHTINGPIDCFDPFMVAVDTQGYPYPVEPSVFEDTWEKVAERVPNPDIDAQA